MTMARANILLVGCGDIGIPLGLQLARSGNAVWGLRRSTQLPDPITTLHADVTQANTLTSLATLAPDYVVVTLTPGAFSDHAYHSVFVEGTRNLLQQLNVLHNNGSKIRRLFFISSTSVYAQVDGEWVDEHSATEPTGFSGKRLLQAEGLLDDCGIASTVIRFAGIYGPGRRRLIDQVLAGQGCPQNPPLYTNRIHRDDCVGFLAHLIERDQGGEAVEPRYIGVDSAPAPMWEVKHWLASQLREAPRELQIGTSHRRGSKRCSNQRLLDSGYQLRYPSYQRGYGAVISDLN